MFFPVRSQAKWVVFCIFCMGFVLPSFADVSYTPLSGDVKSLSFTVPKITLSGHIQQDDLKQFITLTNLAKQESPLYQVELNSLGGDVETALSMGRILRLDKGKASVAVQREGMCFSSCVLVLAGSASRFVVGSVGIHRPYAPIDNSMTADLQKQYYERIEKEVKAYLQEMNIPTELYDHMFRIPPEKIKFLTDDELQKYGLSEDDPYEDAAKNARFAKDIGITAQELLQRKANYKSECSTLNSADSGRCYDRIVIEGR